MVAVEGLDPVPCESFCSFSDAEILVQFIQKGYGLSGTVRRDHEEAVNGLLQASPQYDGKLLRRRAAQEWLEWAESLCQEPEVSVLFHCPSGTLTSSEAEYVSEQIEEAKAQERRYRQQLRVVKRHELISALGRLGFEIEKGRGKGNHRIVTNGDIRVPFSMHGDMHGPTLRDFLGQLGVGLGNFLEAL